MRGWLGSEVARLLPQEYTGTAEAAPTKGSAQERGTAQLVLLSKLVLYKLYTLVRIGHELKLNAPLTRRDVARILCEAIARPERAKGLPAANTFCKNAFNPMPHQVYSLRQWTAHYDNAYCDCTQCGHTYHGSTYHDSTYYDSTYFACRSS